MRIAFITELNLFGKVLRTYENMRTEFAWMVALNADNIHIMDVIENNINVVDKYDLCIVILPKKIHLYRNIENLPSCIKSISTIWGVMQEGPHWYYQDYEYAEQVNYLNVLSSADVLFAHNDIDVSYYKGLFPDKAVHKNQSLLIEDSIKNIQPEKNNDVIIGGNFCSWYSGVDSYFIANEFDTNIYIPSMGRKIENEDRFPNLNHLPYMNWIMWMQKLSTFRYGVHLMRTHAAGTFSLNCSYFGIPCIGYNGLDTQRLLHPKLSVDVGDLESARKLAILLKDDKDFYSECSKNTVQLYNEIYSEFNWLKKWSETQKQIEELL